MKISVALCTYNGEDFISEQIESIINQTSSVDEIIICDDGSNDSTLDILNEYKLKYSNIIKIFQNKNNLGVTKNFERCIELCEGDLILISDQDDIWFENKVSEIINFAKLNPNKLAFFHDLKPTKGEHSLWEYLSFSKSFGELILKKNLFVYSELKFNNFVTGAALAIRKEAKKNIFPLSGKILHDYEIALKLGLEDKIIPFPKILGFYRIHQNQQVGLDELNIDLSKENSINEFQNQQIINYKSELSFLSIALARAKEFSVFIPKLLPYISTFESEIEKVKCQYLNKLSFFKQKKTLLAWYYYNINETKFRDIFFK